MSNQDRVEFAQTMQHYLASLIERHDYAEAVKYFESKRPELDGQSGVAAGLAYHYASQAYASLAQFPIALKTARMAQNLIAVEGDNLHLAEIFITIGSILRDMNELKEAEKALRDAESLFRRYDCLEGQSRALNQLAGLLFKQNDYKNSLSALVDALEIARRLNDSGKVAYMLGNIGRIYTFSGNFEEARKYLRLNIELSEEMHDNLEVARAWMSLGYLSMQQGDYVQAETELGHAYPLLTVEQSKRDIVIYYTYLGELQYRSGQLESSKVTLEQAYSEAQKTAPESSLTARVLRHMAELQIRLQNWSIAERYSALASVIFEKTVDKVEIGALARIKAVIAEAKKRNEESQQLYARAIDLLDETGVRFERAEALIAAGLSNLFSPRQRLTYLFRASEFYVRCKLVRKQIEVDKLIADLEKSVQPQAKAPSAISGLVPPEIDYLTASPVIIQFKEQLRLIGSTDLPILLTGETGVGKDHMARYYHFMVRPTGPFVAINCASLPETLLESELFGYRKGAFTGAEGNKPGLFVTASGGVLFLDEIGDMPLSLQSKLLGVLENRCVVPLGATRPVEIDVKLVAATNRNLEAMVESGGFRRDLFYRISGLSFEIPALRTRKEDIPLLLNYFMQRCGLSESEKELPAELARQFIEHDWPGNTRELFNKVRRLEVMARLVAEGDLVELSRSIFTSETVMEKSSLFERVEQFERKIIVEALLAARGNKSEAARLLGIHEATVRMKLKRYGISAEEQRYH